MHCKEFPWYKRMLNMLFGEAKPELVDLHDNYWATAEPEKFTECVDDPLDMFTVLIIERLSCNAWGICKRTGDLRVHVDGIIDSTQYKKVCQ